MKDREFLCWIHERLQYQYKESDCADFMHKLRAIIKNTDKNKVSIVCGTGNSLEELLLRINRQEN